MKVNVVIVAAVVLAVALQGGNGFVAAEIEAPHLRALEETKPSPESVPQAPPNSPPQESAMQQPPLNMEDYPEEMATPETPEQFARWGCFPGAWNWPQCRQGGGWGCYPGSWRWPRCRWQHRCEAGSWYWPRCRFW